MNVRTTVVYFRATAANVCLTVVYVRTTVVCIRMTAADGATTCPDIMTAAVTLVMTAVADTQAAAGYILMTTAICAGLPGDIRPLNVDVLTCAAVSTGASVIRSLTSPTGRRTVIIMTFDAVPISLTAVSVSLADGTRPVAVIADLVVDVLRRRVDMAAHLVVDNVLVFDPLPAD